MAQAGSGQKKKMKSRGGKQDEIPVDLALSLCGGNPVDGERRTFRGRSD
jgi:hypothetical protein